MKIFFEFLGGSRDGQTDEDQDATGLYWHTDNAEVGKRFFACTELSKDRLRQFGEDEARAAGGPRSEIYEIVTRTQEGDVIRVRCRLVEEPHY